jgi:hypothetical protein
MVLYRRLLLMPALALAQGSPILRQVETAGEIKITGALYEMKTGRVEFLD